MELEQRLWAFPRRKKQDGVRFDEGLIQSKAFEVIPRSLLEFQRTMQYRDVTRSRWEAHSCDDERKHVRMASNTRK